MTWFEFIAAAVAALAWPTVVITVALVLRREIRKANEGDDQ